MKNRFLILQLLYFLLLTFVQAKARIYPIHNSNPNPGWEKVLLKGFAERQRMVRAVRPGRRKLVPEETG